MIMPILISYKGSKEDEVYVIWLHISSLFQDVIKNDDKQENPLEILITLTITSLES